MVEQSEVSQGDSMRARLHKWLTPNYGRITAGVVAATALTAGFLVYYRTTVCDEQLTEVGTAIKVCRRPAATDPPMVAVGLVVLVALMTFFTEVSGFGITLKRELKQVGAKADQALSASSEAKVDAKDAQQTSAIAERVSLAAGSRAVGTEEVSPQDEIDAVIAQYNTIRATQPSSGERTAKLTALVTSLVAMLYDVSPGDFDVSARLADADDGQRLAGYAYLYANPTQPFVEELVEALLHDETHFGQYWAIRALRRLLVNGPSALTARDRKRLENFRWRIPDTDRARELDRALSGAN